MFYLPTGPVQYVITADAAQDTWLRVDIGDVVA